MKLLQVFEMDRLKVELFYDGTNILPNKTYLDGELVYEDDTYRPSPCYDIGSDDVMVALLNFLMLRKSDVEDEFFDDRPNTKLMDFAEQNEDIRSFVFDFEQSDDENFLTDHEMTREEAREITKYIKLI